VTKSSEREFFTNDEEISALFEIDQQQPISRTLQIAKLSSTSDEALFSCKFYEKTAGVSQSFNLKIQDSKFNFES